MRNNRNEVQWMLLATAKKTPPKMNRMIHISFYNNPPDMLEEKVKLKYETIMLYLVTFPKWKSRNV